MPAPTPRAAVPVSPTSYLLVGVVMALFFSLCLVITLQAKWEWWAIPLAALAIVATIVSRRVSRRRRDLDDLAGGSR